MKKLRLEIEALRVESFAPAGTDRVETGTVHAHEPTNGQGRFSCAAGCTQDIQCTNTQPIVSCFDPCA